MEQNLNKLQTELKEQYNEQELSSEQVERLKRKMEQAKQENRREERKAVRQRFLYAAAMVVLIIIALPNTSKTIALAMQQIPVLGDFIELITVRNYQYEDEQYHADINVGEIVISEAPVKEELQKTTEEINAEIQKITD